MILREDVGPSVWIPLDLGGGELKNISSFRSDSAFRKICGAEVILRMNFSLTYKIQTSLILISRLD